MPCAASRGASAATYAGSTVDETSTMRSAEPAVATPSAPNSTVSICAASTTSSTMTSQARASSAGDAVGAAPWRTASACASARMSRAKVATPARTRLCTTPPPIAPVPMTPTRRPDAPDTLRVGIAWRPRLSYFARGPRRLGGPAADGAGYLA